MTDDETIAALRKLRDECQQQAKLHAPRGLFPSDASVAVYKTYQLFAADLDRILTAHYAREQAAKESASDPDWDFSVRSPYVAPVIIRGKDK